MRCQSGWEGGRLFILSLSRFACTTSNLFLFVFPIFLFAFRLACKSIDSVRFFLACRERKFHVAVRGPGFDGGNLQLKFRLSTSRKIANDKTVWKVKLGLLEIRSFSQLFVGRDNGKSFFSCFVYFRPFAGPKIKRKLSTVVSRFNQQYWYFIIMSSSWFLRQRFNDFDVSFSSLSLTNILWAH